MARSGFSRWARAAAAACMTSTQRAVPPVAPPRRAALRARRCRFETSACSRSICWRSRSIRSSRWRASSNCSPRWRASWSLASRSRWRSRRPQATSPLRGGGGLGQARLGMRAVAPGALQPLAAAVPRRASRSLRARSRSRAATWACSVRRGRHGGRPGPRRRSAARTRASAWRVAAPSSAACAASSAARPTSAALSSRATSASARAAPRAVPRRRSPPLDGLAQVLAELRRLERRAANCSRQPGVAVRLALQLGDAHLSGAALVQQVVRVSFSFSAALR